MCYSTFLLFSDPSTRSSEAVPKEKERANRYCQLIFASCCTDSDYTMEKHQTSRPKEAQKFKLLTLTESFIMLISLNVKTDLNDSD